MKRTCDRIDSIHGRWECETREQCDKRDPESKEPKMFVEEFYNKNSKEKITNTTVMNRNIQQKHKRLFFFHLYPPNKKKTAKNNVWQIHSNTPIPTIRAMHKHGRPIHYRLRHEHRTS
jgi:hypothetical protein